MIVNMIAIVKDEKVYSFISEESQKAFLLEQDPTLKFYPFEWDLDKGAPVFELFEVSENGIEYKE